MPISKKRPPQHPLERVAKEQFAQTRKFVLGCHAAIERIHKMQRKLHHEPGGPVPGKKREEKQTELAVANPAPQAVPAVVPATAPAPEKPAP